MHRISLIHAYLPPTQSFRDEARAKLSKSGRQVRFLESEDDVRSALPEMQALLCAMRITADWSKAERLELLQVLGSGVEFLMEGAPFPQQLRVANARGIHGSEMRDHVLAMVLAFAREHPRLARQQRERRFEQFPAGTVAGKRLCIVGLGEVGRSVAGGAASLGMTVLGVRFQPVETPHVTEVVGPTQLNAVLPQSDYVVVCVPLTPQTRGLLGPAELSAVPPHAVLIDVSRGGIVDHEALLRQLEAGKVRGTALDVFPEEPLPADSPWWARDDVIISPHHAGYHEEYLERGLAVFLENLALVEAGMPPRTSVDVERGY